MSEAGQEAGQEAGHASRLSWGLALRVKFGDPRHRRCNRCKRVAVRGRTQCVWHLGAVRPVLRLTPGRIASRTLGRLERQGLLPVELMSLPLWQALGWAATEARAPVRLALVLAWDHRDTAPLVWARHWRQARRVALSPTRARPRWCI